MAWEGGGRSDLVNPNDNPRNSPGAPHSIGIAQWNDRSPALLAFARAQGVDIPEGDLRDARYAQDVIRRIPLQTQLAFAWQEMQGPERRAYQSITAGTDLETATAGALGYHRPAGWTRANPYAGHGYTGRLTLARQIMGAGGEAPPPTGGPPPTVTPPTGGPMSSPPPLSLASAGAERQAPQGGVFGSLFAGLAGETGGGGAQGGPDGSLAMANAARTAAATPAAAPVILGGTQEPQLDLTRLRTLLQGRGRLGTFGGPYG